MSKTLTLRPLILHIALIVPVVAHLTLLTLLKKDHQKEKLPTLCHPWGEEIHGWICTDMTFLLLAMDHGIEDILASRMHRSQF